MLCRLLASPAGTPGTSTTPAGWVFVPREDSRGSVELLGGKAYQLLELQRRGAPVPAWMCLTTSAWEQQVAASRPEVRTLLQGVDYRQRTSVRAASERIVALLRRAVSSDELSVFVGEELRHLSGSSFAVRSSATVEDSRTDSFAGQFDTFLHVARGDVAAAVVRCWESCFSERCMVYAHHRGVDLSRVAMAVVVQEMVASEAAGVMFTRDPSGATADLIVSAGYGLGEGVVSGVVETDTYRRGADGRWEVQIVQKLRRVIGRAQSGSEPSATATTELADVRQSLQDVAVLDSAQRDELARVGLRIAGAYDHPQDIEWAYDAAGRLWLTQTRNITTLEPKAASGAAPSTEAPTVVLDNANIIESYPGITLPLTFSHVQHSYHRLFAGLFARLGLSASYLAQHDHVFAQLVAHVNGRVYYQLSNWYRMFALLPGTRRYIPIWERMLGIQGGLSRSHGGEGNQVWLLLRVVGRLIWGALTISREMAALHERFVSAQDQVRQHALSSMNAERLLGMYDELQDQLLPDWDVTLLNDGYAFIFSGLTQRCAALLGLPATDASSLLKAGDSLESLKPVNELTALGKRLRHHPELHAALRELLRHSPPSQPDDLDHRALALLQGVPELHTAFETYLSRFAERCPEELKLETSSFSERPSAAIRLMLSYAEQDSARAPNADRHDAASPSVGWLRRSLLSPLVGLARRSIRLRESSRLDRARAFGLVRRIFAAIGNDLSRRGAIEAPRDVFSLSQQEIRDWFRQQSEPRDAPHDTRAEPSTERPLATIVRERRAEFERYAQTRLPSRLVLQAPQATPNGSLRQGSVHLEGATLRSLTREAADSDSRSSVDDAVERLRGLGSSAGTVTAAAEIVLSPDWDVDVSGRILVATATDPGWVFLMVQAAGLVVEQGSLLSHSAIVGRELGIPTVVGVSRATRRIETGDEVEVNGSEGTVHVKRAGRAPAVRDVEGSRP